MSKALDRDLTRSWMDQLPQDDVLAESPLFHADLKSMATVNPKAGVTLSEAPLQAHLVLRGHVAAPGFSDGVAQVLGISVPDRLQRLANGDTVIRWIAPDEWLITAPAEQAFGLESALRAAISGHIAVINVSGGQTILRLSGEHARNVLKKSTSYDVSEHNFPIGKAVTTTFAKTQAVIGRCEDQSWELIIRRSFADYAWLWCQDASAEYGLCIHV